MTSRARCRFCSRWAREQEAMKQKAISQVDWSKCRLFTPETLPDSGWRRWPSGDISVTLPNTSYYYFNKDKSIYWSDGKPGNPGAHGRSWYICPKGVKYYTPSTAEQEHGEFFLGVDWETRLEKTYFKDHRGFICLTLRKNAHPLARTRYVALYRIRPGKCMFIEVDEEGYYYGGNEMIDSELEEREPGSLKRTEEVDQTTDCDVSEERCNGEDSIFKEETIKTEHSDTSEDLYDIPVMQPDEEDVGYGRENYQDSPTLIDDARGTGASADNQSASYVALPVAQVAKKLAQPRRSKRIESRRAKTASFSYRVSKSCSQRQEK